MKAYLSSPAWCYEVLLDSNGRDGIVFKNEPFTETHHFLPIIGKAFLSEMSAADPDTIQIFKFGRRTIFVNEIDPLLSCLRILWNIVE